MNELSTRVRPKMWRLTIQLEGGLAVRSLRAWQKSKCGHFTAWGWHINMPEDGYVEVSHARVLMVVWEKVDPA